MMPIGSYFTFIILVMGTILVAQDISKKDEKKFVKDILDAHNFYRHKHASGPLKLNDYMCKMAKRVAREFNSPIIGYTPIEDYAVNYSETDCVDTSDLNPFQIVSEWYEYGNLYVYNQDTFDLKINKFCNIVWKNEKEIGVGIFVSDKKCYVAVLYSPVECRIGQYSSNIIHPDVAAVLNQQEADRFLSISEE